MQPKRIVAGGYDRIGERYAQWSEQIRIEERERFDVTGVDISKRQIERARQNMRSARFICADMTSLVRLPMERMPDLLSLPNLPTSEMAARRRIGVEWNRCTLPPRRS